MVTTQTHPGVSFIEVDFDPFAGPAIDRLAPLTEQQAELWTSCQFGGDDANRAYNESISLKLTGSLNRVALERALHKLIGRHEALHSVFSADGRQVCVLRELPVDITYVDATGLDVDGQKKCLADYVRQDALHLFDLVNGPLLKTALIQLSDNLHYFVFTAHHIVCDGWSIGVIIQELSVLYSAYVRHQQPVLPEAIPYSRYADEQARFHKSPEYRKTETFWVDQYRQSVPVLDLPTDSPRPTLRTYKSSRRDFTLEKPLVQAIRQMGVQAGCSFVTTLMTGFEVFLHRLTGQEDIVLGLPAAGQLATDNPSLVGHCVNLLPLRSRPSGEQPFLDYLKQRKEAVLDAYEHQQLTFGSLLKKINVPRDPSRVPLVPVLFNVDLGMDDGVAFEGLTYELISNPRAFETVDLFLNVSGSTTAALTLEWSYNTQLFRESTIDRHMAAFRRVLETVVANPSVRIGQIALADPAPVTPAPAERNDTDADYPRNTPLHQLLTETAVRNPDQTALIFRDKSVTYQALDEAANQIARSIREAGVKVGDVVGVLLDRSPDLLITLLGVLKAGAAYVPIDPAYPQDRVAFMLTDSGATVLVTSRKYAGRLTHQARELLVETALAGPPAKTAPDVPVSGNDLAYVLYTSGSTGRPKGVLIEHHNLVNLLYSMISWPGMTADDVLLGVTTVSFDIAGLELFLPLLVGATLVLADAETARDGSALLNVLSSQPISMIQATPVTYKMLLAAGWEQRLPLKVLCCGEPLPKDLAQKLIARCNSLWNMYGPTETTIYSTGKQILATDEAITIGRPIQNTQVYILDEQRKPVPNGSVGEIYLAGDGVARGYLNRPELNAEKFVPNPFAGATSTLMYRTGDLGRFTSDGEIYCLGRADHQLKIRGYRVEPGEIEQVLLAQPGVLEALVMAREDRPGDQRLTAYLVTQPALTDDAFARRLPTWRSTLQDSLPSYMVPSDFVNMAQMPITPNGKINRNALPKPSEIGRTSAGNAADNEPANALEEQIACIWKEAIGLDKISVNDDFFELGGHSMIAVQVMARLEKETGRKLPLSTLMTSPTVRKQALLFEDNQPKPAFKSLVPIKPTGKRRPLYIVHGGGLNVLLFNTLARNVDPEQPVYGFQAKGVDGLEEPLGSLEEIAAYYISEILQHNPTGPYAVAGYSYGGTIAYEMAQQLKQMGKDVCFVGLIDTHADEPFRDESTLVRGLRKGWFMTKNVFHTLVLFKEDPMLTISYKRKRIIHHLTRLYWALTPGQKDQRVGFYGYADKIDRMNTMVANNYRMKPYDGRVDVFVARRRTFYMIDPKFLGWKQYALQGVRAHSVPGTHNTLFEAPNDQEFAQVLQQALDACQ